MTLSLTVKTCSQPTWYIDTLRIKRWAKDWNGNKIYIDEIGEILRNSFMDGP